MVFDACLTVSLRCCKCGKLNIKDIPYFELKKYQDKAVYCECGEPLAMIRSLNLKTFHISVLCPICNKNHLYTINWKAIPFRKARILTCPITINDIAFVGSRHLVRKLAAGKQRDIIELISSI